MTDRYSRQKALHFIGEAGQEKLKNARVGIMGCGALGTVAAELLARAGVGYLRIIDRDVVELSNLQRQTLFTENDAEQRLPKAVAAKQKLMEINSVIEVDAVVSDYTYFNALEQIATLDAVVDATDNYLARLTLNDACLDLGIPWVYGGAIGTVGMTMNVSSGGPCFRCVVSDLPALGVGDSCDISGVLGSVTTIVAAIQVAEIIKLLVDPKKLRADILELDMLTGVFRTLPLLPDPDCPACVNGRRDFLKAEAHQDAIVVCGRESVLLRQIVPDIDLAAVAERLSAKGLAVRYNRFRLQLQYGNIEVILYADGRAQVNGVNDIVQAKRYYHEILGG